jgi:sulfite exporter TauE/SafE
VIETTLAAVFVTGLFGGLHCAGMCGGIVGALAHRPLVAPVRRYKKLAVAGFDQPLTPPVCAHTAHQTLFTQLLYNTGRLTTYATLGALAGSVGSLGWWMGVALPLQQVAFGVTNLVLVLMGLYLAGFKQIGQLPERFGNRFWRILYPHALAQLRAPGRGRTLAAGAMWGLVPCGMVYGVLVAALVSGGTLQGAALMLAFGLGTLPSLLLLGTASIWLKRKGQQASARRIAGTLITVFGLLGLARLDAARELPVIGALCSRLPMIGGLP